MAKRFLCVAGAVLTVGSFTVSTTARAQDPACTAQPTAAQDACQKVFDLFRFVAPQLGTMITGGNATLGQIGAIGKTGHFSIGLRVVGMQTDLPDVKNLTISTSGAQASNFPTKQQWAGFPTVDLAVGLFKGLPLFGLFNVGSVDALVNVAYIPKINAGDYQISTPNGSLKLGFGGRVGLMAEGPLTPAVAVTVLRRDLPTLALTGGALTTGDGDSLYVDSLDLHTTSWRVTAGKHAGPLGVVVGIGKDQYQSSSTLHATVDNGAVSTGALTVSQKVDRTNMFVDVNLLFLHAEAGRVSGDAVPTFNHFTNSSGSSSSSDSKTYFSAGFRFGF